ncbi:ADP-ribosylglycohydrolase family protein [Acidovorax sp. SUPP3434]|uniref:ADP-ribosylglycohydrolase family protein n=1 Tax=Acidovorax sp. SUPP3434 TaxID=2920880 RepID=UPI0023DE5D4E|nr:ADP-ribosylglycohydrolase family protein [Acidovorax sp. SUPP3434]GKS99908.1 ADP-ribosylglycohydrolase family protein [Acidovorax sp. SUPP3434]
MPQTQPTPLSIRSRLRGAVYGLLVGDALGVPYEFSNAAELPELRLIEMAPPDGFRRAHPGVPAGTWSDDGAQALHLLKVLLDGDHALESRFADGLQSWHSSGELTPDGRVFDIGIQTQEALANLRRGVPPSQSGPCEERNNGNGSLMRVLPTALLPAADDRVLIDRARRQSLPTHGHMRSLLACALATLVSARLFRGLSFVEALDGAQEHLEETTSESERFELRILLNGRFDPPSGSGYVVDCLWSSVAAVLRTRNFEDCVRCAIGFGNDTDTTACVAGGWAGLLYGEQGIPLRWREQLQGKPLVEPLLDRLLAAWE